MIALSKCHGAACNHILTTVSLPEGKILYLSLSNASADKLDKAIRMGKIATVGENRIADSARRKGITAAQINIAWLPHRSPCILPIPGTTSTGHLKENIKAAEIDLTAEDLKFLS